MSGERGSYDVDEHHLTVEELCERYGTAVDVSSIATSKGLSAEEAASRLQKYGPNLMSPPKDVPEIIKFLKQFTNPLMALLVIAGGFTYMAYGLQSPKDSNNLILASALILVVTATCIMSYLQERSASNVMNSLKKMMPQKCMVTRDGKEFKVDVANLVPGDLVRLYIGDRVPADVRIIQTSDLKVECSSLTGESDLVPASVEKKHDLAAEARNIIFMSSLCMNGEGRGIVIRTGDNTFIGKIASLASETAGHKTTMAIEVHRLVMFVGALAFSMGLGFFLIGLGRHPSKALSAFVNGFILVIVANVPEGLPATVTSCLTLTALRLKERNVLIKKTDIVENLGVATIIASDKTGTLTQNKMTVENIWTNLELRPASTLLPAAQPLATISTSGGVLGRLSRLSRRSRGPGSGALGRTSAKAAGLGRSSRPAGSIALAKVSVDPTTGMSIGRSMVPKGDGTIEATTSPINSGNIEAVNQQSINTFSMQAFADLNAVSWDKSSAITKLVTISTVCNRAKFSGEEGDASAAPAGAVAVPMFQGNAERKILGDATDSGLLRYADRMAPSTIIRLAYPKLHEIPFNSANKWALVVAQAAGNPKQHLVMMKGAPEIVVTKCTHYLHNNNEKLIDDDFKAAMTSAYERCGFMGERVLGFAYKLVPAKNPELYQNSEDTEHAPPTSGLVFMGLISLVDPPREGVKEAVYKCRSAGIRVAMVTGDHPLTAEAIARKVGIITLQTAREVAAEAGVPESTIPRGDERVGAIVVTGQQLREVKSEDEWDTILEHPEIVFARTSPQQKLQIVENLQRLKEVVAVTGDGVNDSPALKKAQIGVSMGSANASDVAREAADIVLLDDEFKSIVVAIEEGRVIYDNLKKTIAYTLTHAVPEVFPIFLNLALGFPVGLGGLLILSIDLLTEQGPAISLAYEHAEANVMERPPRDIEHDRLISGALLRYSYLIAGVFEAWICMVGYFSVFLWYNIPIKKVIWGVDNNHFDYSVDNPEYLRLKCKTVGGVEHCRYNFTPHRQTDIWRMAQTCWYITLVMCQFWHIWVCKTRQVSVFTHGLFRNYVTAVGVLFSILVIIVITYIPALHSIFDTQSLIGIGWLPNLMFLIFILPYSELSKYMVRKDPDSWWAHYIQW